MATQLPASKIYVGLTDEAEYNLKQERCAERRLAAKEWLEKWRMVANPVRLCSKCGKVEARYAKALCCYCAEIWEPVSTR